MKRMLMLVMSATLCLTAMAVPIYENDFSTRTSAKSIPSEEWHQASYSVGKMVNESFTDVFEGDDLQDNWIKGKNDNYGNVSIFDDGGNYEARFFYTGTIAIHAFAKQRIGNVFTSGVVTAQCDLKTPTVGYWQGNPRSVRLMLGDERFFSPDTAANEYLTYLTAVAGLSRENGSAITKFFRNGTDLASAAEAKDGYWYRVVISANLDTKKYGVSFYEMSGHPSLDTPTPASPTHAESDIDFNNASVNVSAIGLCAYGLYNGTVDTTDKTARFDNVRIWHNGVECYVNDFSVRRSRSLATGTTTATYSATTLATNALSYAIGTSILPAVNTSIDKQPVGFDGWRRLDNGSMCSLRPSTVTYTNNATLLINDSTYSGYSAIAAQPLGQTLTNGSVRICVDALQSGLPDGGSFEVFLGSAAMYSGSNVNSGYAGGVFARAGVSGKKQGTDAAGNSNRTPIWGTSTGGTGADANIVSASSGTSTALKWFRIEIVANLDAGTYDYTMYYVCPSTQSAALGTASGEVLFSKSGIARYKSVDEISAFALKDYYSKVYFDNVCVWHRPAGSAEEDLVYSNSFSERKAYSQRCHEDRLVGTIKENPDGIDGWMRLERADKDIMLVDYGANAALGFAAVSTNVPSIAVHDLGGAYKNGKMTVQFDIKAPSAWDVGGGAWGWLGGDQYREGNLNGGAYSFRKWAACGAGISSGTFAAWNGDGVGGGTWLTSGAATSGHWYRFVMTSDIATRRSDVVVYDMGAVSPNLETATPTGGAVAVFNALPFRQSDVKRFGISCVGVEAKGVKAMNPLLVEESALMFDNIRVEHCPSGMMIRIM